MSPDEARADLTRQWLQKADHDLRTVERVADVAELRDVAVFHCQQAAEKSLKAFLTWHSQEFRKTHLLQELVRQCMTIDADFSTLAPAAATLTPHAVEFRYPTGLIEPTSDDAEEALRLARAQASGSGCAARSTVLT
jgi:HEPN domain-containing protein